MADERNDDQSPADDASQESNSEASQESQESEESEGKVLGTGASGDPYNPEAGAPVHEPRIDDSAPVTEHQPADIGDAETDVPSQGEQEGDK